MKHVVYLRLLLLGMWLGAAIFLSAVVAPTAFSVLRGYQSFNASEIAGSLVNRNLGVINLSGFVVGLVLLMTGLLKFRKVGLPAFMIEMASFIVLIVATAIGKWVIAAKLRALRLALSAPIDQLTMDDPRRISFDMLHAYSVRALAIAMIAAFIGFIMVALRAQGSVKGPTLLQSGKDLPWR